MKTNMIKNVVIGGGASGLVAAIECSRANGKNSTILIERQPRTGRKLLATGNGRCNISNMNVSPEHYHGDKKLIRSVLSDFSVNDLKNYFLGMGILLREDGEGRIYPYSNQASTILDGLQKECERQMVEELCDFRIKSIKKDKGKFVIVSEELTLYADNLIFATGSQASPLLGANDSGYRLLETLGINSTPLFPALSPVHTKEKYKNLKGVRAKGSVSVIADGKKIKTSVGEIQFTDYGLSGICVFEISRAVNEFFMLGSVDGKKYPELKLSADVMNNYNFTELCTYLEQCKKIFDGRKTCDILSGALNNKLSQSVAEYSGIAGKPCRSLTNGDIKKLAWGVKNFIFTPVISDGYRSSQVSAGGISSEYIDPETLMSRSVKNLFVCGELLNVDGDCGGYNLHFAIGSGIRAARHASKQINTEK